MKTPATALVRRIPWVLVVFLAALTIPWIGGRYDTFLATQIAISALFAVSLNLLLGTTGLVSFGHVAYFGIGSYVCGILMKTYAMPFAIALPAAAVGAGFGALVFGFVNHFILISPDHVSHVTPDWRPLFAASAALLVVTEAAGVAAGWRHATRAMEARS